MTSLAALLSLTWPGLLVAALAYAVLPWLSRDGSAGRALLIVTSLVLTWRYVAWRLTETLPAPALSADFAASVLFAAAETLTLLGSSITLGFLTRTRDRSPQVEANLPWLRSLGEDAPLVDVLVCTYNEEEAILERTIMGAGVMTYPNYRLWVLDDGRRPWLAALCERLGAGYLTRPDNAHAKAGNINAALRHLAALDEVPAYIAVLDADFVPRANFLERAVPLLRDPAVGIVQTPQHFINPDPIQANLAAAHVWPDEQRYFFDVMLPSKDAWGGCFCCGTSAVIRFDALRRIGGVPTASVTEDYLLSLTLRERGYQTVYLNEKLSLGLAPEGLKEYITQRSRWCLGLVQICRGPLGPFARNGLSLTDRLSLVEAFLYWSASYVFRVLCLVVPVLYWFAGIRVFHAPLDDTLSYFLPYFVAQVVVMVWIAEGRLLPMMADVSQLIAASEILKSVAMGLVRPHGHGFKVTAKGGSRDKRVVQWAILARFLVLLVLTVAGVAYAFLGRDSRPLEQAGALCLFWSWYNIVVLVVAATVCIEQPRRRRHDRVEVKVGASLLVGNAVLRGTVLDISQGGIRLAGAAPAPTGTRLEIVLGSLRLAGTIVRAGREDFGVAFEDGPEVARSLIRYIYAGRDRARASPIRGSLVAGAVVGRVFR